MTSQGNVIAETQVEPAHDGHGTMTLYDVLMRDEMKRRFSETSVLAFHFEMPKQGEQYKLRAIFTNEDVSIEKETVLVRKHSPLEEYFSVWTSSEDLRVGAYATFHLKTNFIVDVFYLLVSVHSHTL